MTENFYSRRELKRLGLKSCGENTKISRDARLYSPEYIEIGDNVRIDDFCILSGKIKIGNNVHISAGSKLYGKYGIDFGDYSGCSANSIIYSQSDDFSGDYMVGAVLSENVKNVCGSRVVLGKYTQLGAGTVIMPGVVIGEGAVTGAMTFVKEDLEPWTINVGIPARVLKKRSKKMLEFVEK